MSELDVNQRGGAAHPQKRRARLRIVTAIIVAFTTATEALIRHPLRALLTGFGIFIGVFSVTIVMTLGEGAERSVRAQVEQLGENLLTVRARSDRASGASDEKAELTERDADAIATLVEDVHAIAPTLDGMARAVYGQRNSSTQVVGTTLSYLTAHKYKIVDGVSWDANQQATGARVVLIGPTLVDELFRGEPPVGQSIRIGRHLFRVIGVLSEKGQTPFGMDLDNIALMPISTMRSKVAPGRPGEVGQIAVAAKDGVDLLKLEKKMRALLRQRHNIGSDQDDDFTIRDQSRMAQAQQGVVSIMKMLLTCIALISLLIGGIGVMNIMLVSVTERSREIGTRLAVGATATDVLVQFLIEAVVLSLLGGALGVVCANLLLKPLSGYFGWVLWISPTTAALGMMVSVSTGVLFGFIPARRAAKLDPVVALRRE